MTPDGLKRAEPSAVAGSHPSRLPFLGGLALGIASVAAVVFIFSTDRSSEMAEDTTLDSGLVAVVPFGFSGPEELQYLEEGVAHLLTPRFDGEVGPRAVDPGSAVALWRDVSAAQPVGAGASVARRLGAGYVVTGSVVAVGPSLTMSATLRSLTDGHEVIGEASGPADSITSVVDRLAAGLLSINAGEYAQSLGQLTSTSPEALKEYLLGQQASRRVRFQEAVEHFRRAVQLDSTFALAAIAWADAGNNASDADVPGALALARRHEGRLSEPDRLYLRARLGPRYPEQRTRAERIRDYQEALRVLPDRAYLWYFVGEASFHTGYGREEGWLERVRGYFLEALSRDPRLGAAIMHILFVDVMRDDVEDLRESARRLASVDSVGYNPAWANAILAFTDPDTTGLRAVHDRFLAEGGGLFYEAQFPVLISEPWMVVEAERGLDAALAAAPTPTLFRQNRRFVYQGYLALGRPGRALDVVAPYERATGDVLFEMRLMDAAYGALPEAYGLAAARMHEELLAGREPAELPVNDVRSLFRLELWRLSRGDASRFTETIEALRSASAGRPRVTTMSFEMAARFLEAELAERGGDSAGARARLLSMRELYDEGISLGFSIDAALHFAMADLYERLGELREALACFDRQLVFNLNSPQVAEYLRERGRLSALLGDTIRAVREYRQYLLLRYDPEPEVEAEVAAVRQALADLGGTPAVDRERP